MTDKPRRRIVMLAKIEADSWDDLYGHLHGITTDMVLNDRRLSKQSISGGYSSGHIIVVDEDGAMTHDKWAADLEAHLDSLRAAETDPSGSAE